MGKLKIKSMGKQVPEKLDEVPDKLDDNHIDPTEAVKVTVQDVKVLGKLVKVLEEAHRSYSIDIR